MTHVAVLRMDLARSTVHAVSDRWRTGILALLVLLPFSGVPVFIAGTPGLLFRDALIILPLYAAFALAMLRSPEPLIPPLGLALPALAAMSALVVAHTFASPSLAVAAIGAKVWLAYIPLIAVGYRYIRRVDDFDRALRLTALLGLIPAAIAIAECVLASRGEHATDPALLVNDFGPFRYLYGGWYEHVSHSVVSFYRPGEHVFVIARVPSTFTSSTQYACFSLIAFSAGLAQVLRSGDARWTACALALAGGALASGARFAYVALPAIVAISFLLGRPRPLHAVMLVAASAGVALIAFVAGAGVLGIAMLLPGHVQQQAATAAHELSQALRTGVVGHGTGWDTNAALRYGGGGEQRYIENWYAKAALELGIAGLVAIALALGSLHVRVLSAVRRLKPDARRLAAPVAAMLAVMTLALFKGPYIDLDPLNVYFWLFAGMLLALARLGRDEEAEAAQ